MSKIIDLTYLIDISGGDNGFIKEMLELFVTTATTESELFDELVENNDFDGISRLAHKMKAAIQMLGANDLFNSIKLLEQYSNEHSHADEIPSMVAKIKDQIQLSIVEIKEIVLSL